MFRLIGYVAAAILAHAGIVNALLLATGRNRAIGEPKRPNILFHQLSKIGLALAISAGGLLSLPTHGSLLIVQICVCVVLMIADTILVLKAITQT